jgi:carbamate kinase
VFANRCTLLACGGSHESRGSLRPDALLRMGQPMTAGNHRESARLAFDRLATIADKHESNLSHENGPQIGLPGMIGSVAGIVSGKAA